MVVDHRKGHEQKIVDHWTSQKQKLVDYWKGQKQKLDGHKADLRKGKQPLVGETINL